MKLLKLVTATTALVLSTNVNSSTVFNVSGIQDLSWLELTVTADMTRSEVELQMAENGSLDGWRYATQTEVETLYDSLWGGVAEGYHATNYDGANLFFQSFGHSTVYDYDNNGGFS